MINVEKLKQERAEVVKEMRDLTSAGEGAKLTQEQADRWTQCNDRAQELDAQIERAKVMNEREMRDAPPAAPETPESHKPESQGFRDAGEFLTAVMRAAHPTNPQRDSRLVEERAEGLNTQVPSEGGFLVGEDIMGGIAKRAYDRSLIAGRCRRQSIGANSNALVWNELDETSRANGSRHGGVLGYWTSESSAITKSQPNFAQRTLKLDKLAVFAYVTEEMMADSTALGSFITDLASDEIAFKLDDAIVSGSGAGMPLGWINADSLITVAKESGQAADTIVYENVRKMRTRLWARSFANAVWYINQDCQNELATMAFVIGTGGVPVYLPAGGVSVDGFDSLYGRPVIPVEQASTVGTLGDINLVDLSQYMIIEKGGINAATSMHVRFVYDEMAFRFTYRVNGAPGPNWGQALTPYKGTDTVSPFVALASRD